MKKLGLISIILAVFVCVLGFAQEAIVVDETGKVTFNGEIEFLSQPNFKYGNNSGTPNTYRVVEEYQFEDGYELDYSSVSVKFPTPCSSTDLNALFTIPRKEFFPFCLVLDEGSLLK